MSAKTMLDLGCLALLDGDPLSLRQLEEELAWRTTGPLPEWLDGTEDEFDDEQCPITPSSIAISISPKSAAQIVLPAASEPSVPGSPAIPPSAHVCLLTVVGQRFWAIPFERIVGVGNPSEFERAVDLFERQEGRDRIGKGVTVEFDNGDAVIVDRVIGPRVFDWQLIPDDGNEPVWMTARTEKAGAAIGLLDWEMLTQSPR